MYTVQYMLGNVIVHGSAMYANFLYTRVESISIAKMIKIANKYSGTISIMCLLLLAASTFG